MINTLIHTLKPLLLLTGIITLMCFASQATAQDTWQEQQLFNPSQSQLKMEERGRVMIYDGFTDKQIVQAMDSQFDRVDSMMFVRTIITNDEGNAMLDDETGEFLVEDDGC